MSTLPADGKVAVLFVCLGNVCRSPMAEAVFPYVSPENAEELAAFGER